MVDADIKGAFDNISHEYLLQAIGGFPARELIKQWLKAGYMEDGAFYDTEAGTPQGGVVSPLLANIALHGMEKALGVKHRGSGEIRSRRAVVRYADDFVVFCESREDAERVQTQILPEWLGKRGLSLSQEKTRIVHLTEGFDFLGFTVRHHKRRYKTCRTNKAGKPKGEYEQRYVLLIRPSKQSERDIRKKLREAWLSLRGMNTVAVLNKLNPIVRGWANYFRTEVASHTFHSLDHFMFQREVRYVKHTHPNKSWHWQRQRYWGKLNPRRGDNWVFGDKRTDGKATGGYLVRFSWFPIQRHVLVKGTSSPDDPALQEYWAERERTKSRNLPVHLQKIARKQKGLCPLCGVSLFNDEEIQQHHKKPRSQGGTHEENNLVLVHLYCQQQIHSGKIEPKDAAGAPLLL